MIIIFSSPKVSSKYIIKILDGVWRPEVHVWKWCLVLFKPLCHNLSPVNPGIFIMQRNPLVGKKTNKQTADLNFEKMQVCWINTWEIVKQADIMIQSHRLVQWRPVHNGLTRHQSETGRTSIPQNTVRLYNYSIFQMIFLITSTDKWEEKVFQELICRLLAAVLFVPVQATEGWR